jgi:hypothetical protein
MCTFSIFQLTKSKEILSQTVSQSFKTSGGHQVHARPFWKIPGGEEFFRRALRRLVLSLRSEKK